MVEKVVLAGLFVILAFSVMFVDAQVHLQQYTKPSMALLHGGHGGHGGGMVAGASGYVTMAELYELPFFTRQDIIERYSYTEDDGVKEFHMTIDEFMWEYAEGKYLHAWGFNHQIPGPEFRVTEGDRVRVHVKNNLPVPTTVHWHGIDVENAADGVPGYTQYPIEPGDTYIYEFDTHDPGTRFYHSHGSLDMMSVTQMDMGMAGAFIIEPKEPSNITYDKEFVYLLDEWSVSGPGFNGALEGLGPGGGHAHGGHAGYNTYTINGLVDPWIPPMVVEEGDRVLIRMINVGTSDIHPMHSHGHSFRVVALDGNAIPRDQQVIRDVVTINPSERVDIEIIADNPGAWLFHCHHLHHSAAGMKLPFLYEGHEQCCEDQ